MSDFLPPDHSLPPNHFLNLPRPDIVVGAGDGIVDTTTLAAHDFDVDTRTGFMPPDSPISRLPEEWEPWEATLDKAMSMKLQLAVKLGLTEHEIAQSCSWRTDVRNNLPVLSTKGLTTSELLLRRAHHVLTYIMHSYIHTLPLDAEIRIPASISIPLLEVSAHLQLPPVATYSDTVLYNWDLKSPSEETATPALDNLRSQELFTGTNDEQEFYLASSRIEIRGVEALELMRATMDEMFVGDEIAVRRITGYLHKLAAVVDELKSILLDVRKGCEPEFFYHSIRPWFRGEDSDPLERKWAFEGLEEHPEIAQPTDLSGPSAGQSALIHALDIFLGLDNCSTGEEGALSEGQRTLLRRMQIYMPRHHRNFLRHLSANPRPVRSLVMQGDPKLVESYNDAVRAVKEFRDAHFRIVTIYIIGPASRERQARREEEESGSVENRPPLKGTGGTHLAQFLKGVRDKTADAMVTS
ncbi:indoleamine 2,3-dioxygenase [Paxillus involutus ATCC 200175]|uniref:Indoleamine 2,3-dioxygenase n=1 Tax=Paxillus involutus ATCC 200175 TaxID=664439 RepID=A0A0C9SRW9_PAXIN|nr:indoleamine 2,3-dioxygenase [Paxillus involutus ATCC 200175]